MLDTIIRFFPPIAASVFFFVAGIIFAVGFFRRGMDFVKHGFRQKAVGNLAQKIDDLQTEFKNDIKTIEVNHFGHLKNYLGILNGVLFDKKIIDNEIKARLDNELRGM